MRVCTGLGARVVGAAAPHRGGEALKLYLFEQLLIHECFAPWEIACVPVHRLGSLDAVFQVVTEFKEYLTMTTPKLKQAYADFGLLVRDGIQTQELLDGLRIVLVWRFLPLPELLKECVERDLPVTSSGDDLEQRTVLFQRLLMHTSQHAYELRGIRAEQCGSIAVAAYVSKEYEKLDAMDINQLREEVRAWCIPPDFGLSRAALLATLRQMVLWSALPVDKLVGECAMHKVAALGLINLPSDEDGQREELLDRLLFRAHCKTFEVAKIPAQKLGSFGACVRVVMEWAHIDAEADADTAARYANLGFPEENLGKYQIAARMKQLAIWMEMPLNELQAQCRMFGITTHTEEDQRVILVLSLAEAVFCIAPSLPPAPSGESGRTHASLRSLEEACSVIAHLRTLSLPRSAGIAEVKKAYRKLALKHHPDKHHGESQKRSAEEFLKVAAAYEALCGHFKPAAV